MRELRDKLLILICLLIEPIWDLFTKVKVQYPSGFYGSYSHLS
ncbi:hypothetical protein RintRC_3271 [Richelia intracellularis]|nr:hypothetical protein RintRC_3271 [Richelia intracellularis]